MTIELPTVAFAVLYFFAIIGAITFGTELGIAVRRLYRRVHFKIRLRRAMYLAHRRPW